MPRNFPAIAVLILLLSLAGRAEAAGLTVFAAASAASALSDVAKRYEESGGARVEVSFAASSILAKQIAHGAPADLFVSASPQWMDFLAREKALEPGTRANLLGNRLVLIFPIADARPIALPSLARRLGDGRLAMGDPDHVPAGIYGKAALKSLELWDSVADRIAPMPDVRAALTLVERGETPAGIVYATDAAISAKVRIVAVFPADSYPPIVYPVAIVAGRDGPEPRRFLDFLKSAEAQALFVGHGFTVP